MRPGLDPIEERRDIAKLSGRVPRLRRMAGRFGPNSPPPYRLRCRYLAPRWSPSRNRAREISTNPLGLRTMSRRDTEGEPRDAERRPRRRRRELPPARMIDPRGHRFGAGLSALLLIASFVAGWVPGVALALLSIGTSAAFGLRYSIYGAIWRRIVKRCVCPRSSPSTSTRRASRRRSAASLSCSRCWRSRSGRRRSVGSSRSRSRACRPCWP